MSNYLIYIRKNNGICQKISLTPDSSLHQLINKISELSNRQVSSSQITFKGSKLNNFDLKSSIKQSRIPNNAILQIIPIQAQQPENINILLEYNSNVQKFTVKPNTTINLLRKFVEDLFGNKANIQFEINKQKIFNDDATLNDLGVKQGDIIKITDKKIFKSLLELQNASQNFPSTLDQVKNVQSVVSSQQTPQQSITEDDRNFRKQYRSEIIKKKSQCIPTTSLKKIQQGKDQKIGKRSAIVSSNLCSQFLNSPSVHRNHGQNLLNLNQIRQTMSFGSLEDSVPDQFQVQIYSQDMTKFYKFRCPQECQAQNIKAKLCQIERVQPQRLQIRSFEEKDSLLVSNMSKNMKKSLESSESSHQQYNNKLVYKILS